MSDQRKARKPPVDLEALAHDYRSGQFSDRELATKYQRSHTWVANQARDRGWQKDLEGALRVATAAKLASHEIAKTGNQAVADAVARHVERALPATTEYVSAMAEVNSQVILRHRNKLAEVAQAADRAREKLVGMIDETEGLRDAASIVAAVESAARTIKTLIDAERKAYGLTDEPPEENRRPPPTGDASAMDHYRWLVEQVKGAS